MGKGIALLFIVMIAAETTMPTLVMGCDSHDCPLAATTPSVHDSRGSPAGVRSCRRNSPCPPAARTPSVPGNRTSPATGRSGGRNSSCPVDALKLGACVDLLGGLVHLGIGDPVVNQCCPLLASVLKLEAALCLCTTIRLKVLNINAILPLALELFVKCGLTPPPGFRCPPLI